jgi:hypothetical protein
MEMAQVVIQANVRPWEQKKGLLFVKAGHWRLLPRACRFDAYPVPYSRVDDRRKAR